MYHYSCSPYFLMLSIDSWWISARSSIVECKMIAYVTQVCYPTSPSSISMSTMYYDVVIETIRYSNKSSLWCNGCCSLSRTDSDGRVLASRYRRTERQLVAMLLVQVTTYLLLTLPPSVIYSLLVLSTTYKATRSVYFAYSIFSLPFHLSYVSAFTLLPVRVYRHEFLRRCLRHVVQLLIFRRREYGMNVAVRTSHLCRFILQQNWERAMSIQRHALSMICFWPLRKINA